MSKINSKKQKSSATIFIAAIIAMIGFFQPVQAGTTFDVYINVENCEGTVEMGGSDGCNQGQCDGVKACMCLSKHDKVRWEISSSEGARGNSNPKFRLEFHGDSPLKENCGRNFHKNQQNCVVKDAVAAGQAFDYDILVENCPDPIDPRIIIQ
jgi:hypothetical protein